MRILTARYSPPNGCHAKDGELLVIAPRPSVPVKTVVPHSFLALPSRKRSRFGWVTEVTAQPIPDLFASHGAVLEPRFELFYSMLLERISNLPPGTSVGCDYLKDGLSSSMSLSIHPVSFHGGPPKGAHTDGA
jgi:hypothetical protein